MVICFVGTRAVLWCQGTRRDRMNYQSRSAKSRCRCTRRRTRTDRLRQVRSGCSPRPTAIAKLLRWVASSNQMVGGLTDACCRYKILTMNVPNRMDFVNITGEVEKAVKESRVREGLCLVTAMHIIASLSS